jgi:hypothetical protein
VATTGPGRRWASPIYRLTALVLVAGAAVVGCGSAPSTKTLAPSVVAAEVEGPYRLELVLAKPQWASDEPLTGTATLSFDGAGGTTIYGSGRVLNFAYAEVGGTRKVDPVWTANCAVHELDAGAPISMAVTKSGAASADDPETAWLHSFIMAPDVRLPPGTWDVTALAIFMEVEGCDGPGHSMEATVRVTVTD